MIKKFEYCFVLLLFILTSSKIEKEENFSIVDATVEMQLNPEGVSLDCPRFSWKMRSIKHDIRQVAYQIEVAVSEDGLNTGDDLFWNSGYVESDSSILIPYSGQSLSSGKDYYWRVTVWNNIGEKATSEVQHWGMALSDSDWKAKWIGLNDSCSLKYNGNRTILPARYLRKSFMLKDIPKRAMLYISGVGSSVCYINGQRVGNDVFGPLPTWYDASVSYLTYDVTSLLTEGENALGVILGNGRYLAMRINEWTLGFGLPRMIAQLNVEYVNGKNETIVSDESWMATNEGPITENNEYDGEKYDARLELGNWSCCNYKVNDKWKQVDLMSPPKGKLVSQLSPCVKVMEILKPISIKCVGNNRYIVDMGQNMVGLQKVKLFGKKNKPITMRFSEVLQENGQDLYLDNIRSALVTDVYTPAVDGEFTWEPTFVYHGFRFMEITGIDYKPSIADFEGKVIYDQMQTIGHFETSDSLLNRLYKNAYWGIRGNYRGMPTDCPQRDERLGWLGDRTTGAYGESFLFGNALLYRKWLVDIEESMSPEGSISNVSPRYWTFYQDDATWPAAYFYIADMLYCQFGDDYSIRNRYFSMKRWVQHMVEVKLKNYIITKDEYGDWCVPPERLDMIFSEDPLRKTNGELLGTSVFYSIIRLMEKFAKINNFSYDAKFYSELADKIKLAYNDKFFNKKTCQYDNNTVTANLLSLRFGLVPLGYEEKVFTNIINKIEQDFDSHVSVGVLGIQHLMRGLTENGALELAYKIATNETYPSWGYMIRQGATTIWELWNGDTADPSMNSRNHVMLLGDLLIWFYENIAGIRNHSEKIGFKRILMQPQFPKMLNYVNSSYVSPYGEIKSCWNRKGDVLNWSISIPVNSVAELVLPSNLKLKVENNQNGIHWIKKGKDELIIEVGSGEYVFSTE